uniref:Uncharacterized protein n=1 Tax=Manihot esculenta TaxID=3983 RepID=A0A2C9WMN4_MANES
MLISFSFLFQKNGVAVAGLFLAMIRVTRFQEREKRFCSSGFSHCFLVESSRLFRR